MYKFSIAAENAMYDGYTTEKLISSFLAHTVPIYWGNRFVAEEFNPEAFVNCNDYSSIDEVIKRVKEIDEDDDLWGWMVSRPWQTEEQKKNSDRELEELRKFTVNIFSQPLEKARRRPEGTYADICWRCFAGGRSYIWKYTDPKFLRKVFMKLKGRIFPLPKVDIDDFLKEHKF